MEELPERRQVFVNGVDLTEYESNYVSTTQYTLYNFLPLSLFNQFRRAANIYFLVTAVLQSIPEISPLHPFSAIAPLVFVLTVSMVREGIEDYLRYKADQEINSAKTQVYVSGKFSPICFKDVQVGHLVLVMKNEVFPSDLVMLSNSNENGVAFIETSTLDGEKNLKPRTAFKQTLDSVKPGMSVRLFAALECELPNPRIDRFNGTINYFKTPYALGKEQLLVAGAFLRNTEWAIGVSAYTGNDTKLRQNLMKRRVKQSQIEVKVNRYIICIILCQVSLCLFAGIASGVWAAENHTDHWYLGEEPYEASLQGFLGCFTYFLLLNTMLPISLIISLEIVKLLQGLGMQRDPELFSEVRERHCKVSSFSLNEELGMIQHIFTDKTGTLTCNKMEFKYCTVGHTRYGEEPRSSLGQVRRRPTFVARGLQFTFDPHELVRDTFERAVPLTRSFLTCLALCHECMAEQEGDTIKYTGQSPDEIALVDCARWSGFTYLRVVKEVIDLEVKDPNGVTSLEQYVKLALFEFDSDRKRNSVVVRNRSTGECIMYAKGADNIMLERLSANNDPGLLAHIRQEITYFSQKGLRTLLIAYRVFSSSEAAEFQQEYDRLADVYDNRELARAELADRYEREFLLLGCTAVEDALQAEVPAAIYDFLRAGIKVWMLTGDKMETAENIGKTCSLLEDPILVQKIKGDSPEACLADLRRAQEEFGRDRDYPKALIVAGEALEHILVDRVHQTERVSINSAGSPTNLNLSGECKALFFHLADQCKTIICCRATPGQKQRVVRAMKLAHSSVTLAIGDGANDVSMILEAHVGIGLYGEEGMQSVQASDYAIGEFKYLWELLFVHGRLNYIRQSEMIMYFFYKNLVFTLPQFIFMFYCGYSGQTVYDDWYITFYNMVFTALPLLIRALFDVDIVVPTRESICPPEEYLGPIHQQTPLTQVRRSMPLVYAISKENQVFTRLNFLLWLGVGTLHCVFVFMLPFYAAEEGVLGSTGHSHNLWTFSITSFSCVILVVNLKLALSIRNWNLWHHLAIFLSSIFLYFVFILVYDGMGAGPSYLTVFELLGSYYFYFCMIALVSLILVVDGGWQIIRRLYWPNPSEVLMDYAISIKRSKNTRGCLTKWKTVPSEQVPS